MRPLLWHRPRPRGRIAQGRETWVPLDPCGARAGGGTSPSGGSLRSPPAKHGSTPFRGRHGLRASGCHHGRWWFARRPHVLRWFVCHHRRWLARRPHVLRWFARARPQVLVSRSSSTCGLTLLANQPLPPSGHRFAPVGAEACPPGRKGVPPRDVFSRRNPP